MEKASDNVIETRKIEKTVVSVSRGRKGVRAENSQVTALSKEKSALTYSPSFC